MNATTLLRELRPEEEHAIDEAALERILTAAPETRRRRRARPIAVVATLAALALIAIAIAPAGTKSPSVIARAAAALSEPDTIESWQTTSGRQERTIFGVSGLESVQDQDAKTFQTYNPEKDEILNHTDPDYFDDRHAHPAGIARGGPGIVTVIGDLKALLADPSIDQLEDTEVRGIPVHHLRITRTEDVLVGSSKKDMSTQKVTMVRDVYIATDGDLPVRVVDHMELPAGTPMPHSANTYDFVVAERIPLTADTTSLLKMAPHPGAHMVEEGRVR
jgi:hypothetical protein